MCLDTCLLDKAYCDILANIYIYIYIYIFFFKKYVCGYLRACGYLRTYMIASAIYMHACINGWVCGCFVVVSSSLGCCWIVRGWFVVVSGSLGCCWIACGCFVVVSGSLGCFWPPTPMIWSLWPGPSAGRICLAWMHMHTFIHACKTLSLSLYIYAHYMYTHIYIYTIYVYIYAMHV